MRVRIWYERPNSVVVDLDPPDDLDEDELADWILDNAPIREAIPTDWDDA